MNQNDANMNGARGLCIGSHPQEGLVWLTPTIWSAKAGQYIAYKDNPTGKSDFLARISDMAQHVSEHVGSDK